MLPLKIRKRLLNKLAQAVPGSPASPTSPTSPNAPTTPASTTAQAIQPPTPFNMLTTWGWLPKIYNPNTLGYLSGIMNIINTVMHYTTAGKFSLSKSPNNIGGIDASAAGSDDGKNAVLLAKEFFDTFLNKGQELRPAPTPEQIQNWCNTITNSQPLLNLAQLNPTGPAAQQMRLPDSFRQTIVNSLEGIKRYNPAQQQPR